METDQAGLVLVPVPGRGEYTLNIVKEGFTAYR